jgi:succinate dehydrogenase / fumarate reductase, cytochrome b subunit
MKTAVDQFSQSQSPAPSSALKHPQAVEAPKKREQSMAVERPLSPFMFPMWYRFQITSTLSILHRLTGIALALGSILLVWWLVAVAAGGEMFRGTRAFLVSPIGLLLLFCWSLALFYHLCSGIRHLFWDAGYGFEIRSAYRSGYVVLAATVVLTAFAWLYVLLA